MEPREMKKAETKVEGLHASKAEVKQEPKLSSPSKSHTPCFPPPSKPSIMLCLETIGTTLMLLSLVISVIPKNQGLPEGSIASFLRTPLV